MSPKQTSPTRGAQAILVLLLTAMAAWAGFGEAQPALFAQVAPALPTAPRGSNPTRAAEANAAEPVPVVAAASASASAREGKPSPSDSRLDLNTATVAELDALPGVGAKRAQQVIELRDKLGGFRRVEELLRLRGVGKKFIERIRPLVRVVPKVLAAEGEKRMTPP